MIAFIREAGAYALAAQDKITQSFKDDYSIVTETDLAISRMFAERLAALPNASDHFLIDEEFIAPLSQVRETIEKTKYVWVLDPIDGTTPYSVGMPLWGILLSLFIDGKPAISAINLPALGELLYTDGTAAYLQKRDTMPTELAQLPVKPLHRQSIVLAPWNDNYTFGRAALCDFYAAALFAAYTLLGRSAASFLNNTKLWDVAAILPLAPLLGLTFRNIDDGGALESLDLSCFDENWLIRGRYLLCHPTQYEDLRTLPF